MAADTPPPTHDRRYRSKSNYDSCLLTPMGRDDDGTVIDVTHVIDAVLVGLLAFFAVIAADVLPSMLAGNPVFLTTTEIMARMPTAGVAFGLAFVFQWLRARGIDVLEAYRKFKDSLP